MVAELKLLVYYSDLFLILPKLAKKREAKRNFLYLLNILQ